MQFGISISPHFPSFSHNFRITPGQTSNLTSICMYFKIGFCLKHNVSVDRCILHLSLTYLFCVDNWPSSLKIISWSHLEHTSVSDECWKRIRREFPATRETVHRAEQLSLWLHSSLFIKVFLYLPSYHLMRISHVTLGHCLMRVPELQAHSTLLWLQQFIIHYTVMSYLA